MFSRPLFACFSLLLLAGCSSASEPDVNVPSGEEVDSSQEELTAAASKLVGHWRGTNAAPGGLLRLSLRADGSFSSTRSDDATAPTSGFVEQNGTWIAVRSAGKLRLRLRASGEPTRGYDAVKTGKTLKLSAQGTVETLSALSDDTCFADADCGADQTCGEQMCLMACQFADPFCCGPRTCVDRTPPPPPPSCGGAWVDQFGNCRAPNDGVLPASCCPVDPPEPCGDVVCGAGTVCCNPLAGICTAPGQACAF